MSVPAKVNFSQAEIRKNKRQLFEIVRNYYIFICPLFLFLKPVVTKFELNAASAGLSGINKRKQTNRDNQYFKL